MKSSRKYFNSALLVSFLLLSLSGSSFAQPGERSKKIESPDLNRGKGFFDGLSSPNEGRAPITLSFSGAVFGPGSRYTKSDGLSFFCGPGFNVAHPDGCTGVEATRLTTRSYGDEPVPGQPLPGQPTGISLDFISGIYDGSVDSIQFNYSSTGANLFISIYNQENLPILGEPISAANGVFNFTAPSGSKISNVYLNVTSSSLVPPFFEASIENVILNSAFSIKLENDFSTINPNVTALATRADTSGTPIVRYDWSIVVPPSSAVTVPATTTINTLPLILDVFGEYAISVRAFDGSGYSNTATQRITLVEKSFSVSDFKIAQSPYLQSNALTPLIRKKPIVAKVSISSPESQGGNQTLVGVKGLFVSGNQNYELVGCFPFYQPNNGNPAEIYLTQKVDAINQFDIASGTFDIEINPVNGVSGIPAGLGCGVNVSNQVQFNSKTSTTHLSNPKPFASFESPSLSVSFLRVVPFCNGTEGCQEFRLLEGQQLLETSSRASKLIRAMFPVAPTEPYFKSAIGPDVKSFNKEALDFIAYKELLCSHTDTSLRRLKCEWEVSEMYDLNNIRATGRLLDTSPNARYVGIVPDSSAGGAQGYFQWLLQNYPFIEPGYADAIGIESEAIPQATAATDQSPMVSVHELGHSFHLRYGEDGGHAPAGIAPGFWVTRKIDLASTDSFISGERAAPSVMLQALPPASWPQIDRWIDADSYQQLYDALTLPRKTRVQQFNGEQHFIFGGISRTGKFALGGVLGRVNPGQTVGVAEHYVQIQLNDPAGIPISVFASPIIFSMDIGGSSGKSIQTEVAPISTGVPANLNAISLTLTSDINRTPVTFFPSIETLRTGVSLVPDKAFISSIEDARAAFSNILRRAESLLKLGDLTGARSLISGEFRAALVQKISDSFQPSSGLENGLSEIFTTANGVSEALEETAQNYPALSNGIIRVQPQSFIVTPGSKDSFSIFLLTETTNPELEFFLAIKLNGQRQKEGVFDGSKWLYRSPALASGHHTFEFQLYSQPKRQSRDLIKAIESAEEQIFLLNQQLQDETDPDVRSEIEVKIEDLGHKIHIMGDLLSGLRHSVGSLVQVPVDSN